MVALARCVCVRVRVCWSQDGYLLFDNESRQFIYFTVIIASCMCCVCMSCLQQGLLGNIKHWSTTTTVTDRTETSISSLADSHLELYFGGIWNVCVHIILCHRHCAFFSPLHKHSATQSHSRWFITRPVIRLTCLSPAPDYRYMLLSVEHGNRTFLNYSYSINDALHRLSVACWWVANCL